MSRLRGGRRGIASVMFQRLIKGRASERGAVLALVALGAITLLGAVGLAIDGSRMLEERRHAQAAADHAALAAAYAKCKNTATTATQAETAGRTSAQANGFTHNPPRVQVDLTAVKDEPTVKEWEAVVTSTIDATFARVLGFTTFQVSADAVAQGSNCGVTAGPSLGAIYAGGDNCTKAGPGKYQLDVTGQNQRVYGGVHSNADVNIGTKPNWWTEAGAPADPFTYSGQTDPDPIPDINVPGGNLFEAGYPQVVPARTWPASYAPSVLSHDLTNALYWTTWAAKATADGNLAQSDKITTINRNGVWYTTHADGFEVSTIEPHVTNFTLVARNGKVDISYSASLAVGRTFSPDTDGNGLLIVSGLSFSGTEKCDKQSVKFGGSRITWNGIVWAPGGQIEFSGQGTTGGPSGVNGSLVGWSVKLNGSDTTLRGGSSPGTSAPAMTLQQ